VNLAFHAANVVLVYLWFRRATGAVWRSALVAAIFAVHPLRVESVAWIVERKDVLTAFFAMLAMLAYVRFARTLKWGWYAAVVAFFAAALLAKQTLATLPFLLLLLDYWPLGRWLRGPAPFDPQSASTPRGSLPRLVIEKLPLLVMAAAVGCVTMKAQATTGSVASLTLVPLSQRLANAPVSYVRYLGKMVWFGHLAALYPMEPWSTAQVVGACALLAAITAAALVKLRSSPWLAVGWFWFLGVLVPMIGLVQFAGQSMADRFTYISGIGILLMVVWSIPTGFVRRMPTLAAVGATAVLATLCLFTLVQIGYWRNGVTLFSHDIDVVGSNLIAENNLGTALFEKGDYAGAVTHLQNVIRLDPSDAHGLHNLGYALMLARRTDEACQALFAASQLDPADPATHGLFAHCLNKLGKYGAAEHEARLAIEMAPKFAEAHNDLGIALLGRGELEEAADEFRLALGFDPGLAAARQNLHLIATLQNRAAAAKPGSLDIRAHPTTGTVQ
jgi:Flp pilus assembly protein TadD